MDRNLCLVIDTKEYKFIVKQRFLTFSIHKQLVCSREESNDMRNQSLVSRLIGGPENVRAAECNRRFNVKIGHSLIHSLFQHDDIVARSLYETLLTKSGQGKPRLFLLPRIMKTKVNNAYPWELPWQPMLCPCMQWWLHHGTGLVCPPCFLAFFLVTRNSLWQSRFRNRLPVNFRSFISYRQT